MLRSVGPVQVSYAEAGDGPAAVFLHGFPLNSHHWRHALAALGDIRRCIAPDLLGLGHTRVPAGHPLDVGTQARVMLQFLDELGIDRFDLVGNDTGGGIAQLVAASAPDRVRSLVLTNCDTHDNFPPASFAPTIELARNGQLADLLAQAAGDHDLARRLVASAYEAPEKLSSETLSAYLDPIVSTSERRSDVNRFLMELENTHNMAIEEKLRALKAPALIVWGDGDGFFATEWADWLAATLPAASAPVILSGAKLFFPEERPDELNALIRAHWLSTT